MMLLVKITAAIWIQIKRECLSLRVVDENIQLPAGNVGHLVPGSIDAVLVRDVELDGAHAHGSEVLEHIHVTCRSNNVAAYESFQKLNVNNFLERKKAFFETQLRRRTSPVKFEGESMPNASRRTATGHESETLEPRELVD